MGLAVYGYDSRTADPTQSQKTKSGNQPSAKPTPDTSPEKAWAEALALAKANSPQESVTVKPGDTLSGIASSHHDTLASLEAVNPQIHCPNLIHNGQTVYLPKETPDQVVTGVDNSQIKPIITAMANANAAGPGSSAKSWSAVEQTTYNMLIDNNTGAYPELKAEAEIEQLNALEPSNAPGYANFVAANNQALAQATQQWSQMGVTKDKLGPIIDAYNNAEQTTNQVTQFLNSHHDVNRGIVSDLMASEQQANTQLQSAIEKSLTDAANQAGTDPKARSAAMTERAADIQLAGPQDQAFQTAVDNANYDLQVTKPAEQVADAYAKGGAVAAADELKTVTQNAGNAYYASQIIEQSKGTIDEITSYLGSQASNAPMPRQMTGRAAALDPGPIGPTPTQMQFNQIYADLSQSVEAANTLTVSHGTDGKVTVSLSADGKAAANLIANSIASNAPKNLQSWQNDLYENAASNATSDGNGLALTLATAAALKQHGNANLASDVVEGAATGLSGQGLASKASTDVTAYDTTMQTLNTLRTTWGPFMTASQLAKATNGYLADHPDVKKNANAELATISQDGDAIAEAESAWSSYGGQLNGIDGLSDLSGAAKSLTGTSSSAAFAVSQSTKLNAAIATAIGPQIANSGSGGSVVQALIASPIWSLPKSTRSFVNGLLKTSNARAAGAKPYGQGTFTTLSFVGLALTAETAWAKGFPMSSPQDLASSTYTALGFPKYTGEVISGLAKNSVVQDFLSGNSAFTLATDQKGKPVLSLNLPDGDTTINLTNLTKTGWFKALGSAYYGAGALASVLSAIDDFKNGDDVDGYLDSGEALGNVLNAAKPLVEELAPDAIAEGLAEGVGAVGSGIGLLAAVGILVYQGIKSAQATQAFQADTTKFLQQGLGLNSNLAQELSAPGFQPNGASASAALQAYAKAYHLTPAQLLQELSQKPIDKAINFIDEAADMPTQSNGHYALTLSTDDPRMVGTHKVTELGDKGHNYTFNEDYQANSLRQLKYWADYLFGQNQVG
jgi:hypothetical protein